jgi:prepilin-type N-terminal cleavage/methylation domain-containing protein
MNINMRQQSRKQRGFTLIEIAIVLVIIGLLLGGVLQGQQLIENSRVKSATNDFNGIAAAVFSYQDRYGRLPGDDPGAAPARGASWPAASAGNGNGVIAAAADPFAPLVTDEVQFFFQNLRSAGFIAGDPADTLVEALPANPFGGLITIVTGSVLDDATGNPLAGTKVCMGNVSGTSAIALDTQLDDGNSVSGRFRASDDAGVPNTLPAAAADAAYTEDLSYTVCYRI